jgi:site-specific DNA recombinase
MAKTTQAVVRCALYGRVSTAEQAKDGYGLQAQLHDLRALAAKRGYTIVEEYTDEGVSGATLDRPRLDALRQAIKAREVDVVLAHASDRIARDLNFLLLVRHEMLKAGVKMEYFTHSPDDSAVGQFQEQVLGAVGQLERAMIRERTARGRRQKARSGLIPAGPAPFGYRRDPDRPGTYVVDVAEAEVVRRMFAWIIDGASSGVVASRLNAQSIPTRNGARWDRPSVCRLLRNSTYKGTAVYNRTTLGEASTTPKPRDESEWIVIPVPAIITSAQFSRAEQQLERNRTRLVGKPGYAYFLKGVAKCGTCGHSLVGTNEPKRRVYRCHGRRDLAAPCREKAVRCDVLDGAVWREVVGFLKDPSRLLPTVKAKALALDADRADAAAVRADLDRQLAKVQGQRSKLLDLYLIDGVTKAAFETKDGPLKAEEERLHAALHEAVVVQEAVVVDSSRHHAAVAYCKLVAKGVDHLDEAGRRQLLGRLVDRVVVHADRIEVHGLLRPEYVPMGPGKASKDKDSAAAGYRCASRVAHDHRDRILGLAARRRRRSAHRPVRLHARCAGRPRRDVDDDPDRHLRPVHATATPALRRDDDLDRGTAR